MCCDLEESVRDTDFEIQANKDMNFFVFYCLENHSISHNFGTAGPIKIGFSDKYSI